MRRILIHCKAKNEKLENRAKKFNLRDILYLSYVHYQNLYKVAGLNEGNCAEN